jgi:selenocysteine lyase/cysteine desulfurase
MTMEHDDRPIANQRHLFEIPDEIVYLNCASFAPQMRSVREAGEQALARTAQPWTLRDSDWFDAVDRLRALFAQLIGATANDIAIIPATSYGLAVAAQNLRAAPGDRVLLVAEDFPSNVYTWQAFARRTGAEMLTVQSEPGQSWTDAILEKLDERVKTVSVPNVHWTNGALIDLDRVGRRAREMGAAFVIDATQSLGAMPLDVASLRPDYLVGAGYKWLLGPFSLGYLYVDAARQDGVPLEQNWISHTGSEDFASLINSRDEYQPGARRYDVGQRSNFTLTPMATAALSQLIEWKVEWIAQTMAMITGRIQREVRGLGLEMLDAGQRCSHMLGIKLPEASLSRVAAALAEKKVYVAVRGSYLRVSPHLFVSDADVDRFVEVLAGAVIG